MSISPASVFRFPKPVLGLAGAPGAGKSQVAQELLALGCVVIDADALARAALETSESKAALRQKWGGGVFDEAGKPDRAAIARRAFADASERKWLEQLIHPQVRLRRQAMREEAFKDEKSAAVVEDCPLLFEMQMDADCDAVLFVDAPLALRQKRVGGRGWSAQELADRENAQWPLDIKRKKSDYTLVNDADLSVLRQHVRELFQSFLVSKRRISSAR